MFGGDLLNQDCIEHVLSFLPFSLIVRISTSAPLTFERKKQLREHQALLQRIPAVLVHIVGYLRLLDVPVLPWRNTFLGNTGYIDRIKVEDVYDTIMIGIDCFCRPFITIRSYCHSKKTYGIITLFQRYSDQEGTWTLGTRYGIQWVESSTYFLVNDRIRPDFRVSLQKLCQSDRVVHPVSRHIYSIR